MAVKRIGILLHGMGIFGGINIVLNWAVVLAKAGYHVEIILPPSACRSQVPFLSEQDSRLLERTTEIEARRHRYHAVIATNWKSIALMVEFKADHYAWFMQAYESQFLDFNAPAQADFDNLVASQINVITTAHWLEEHILRHYTFELKRTFCVVSGLDKTLWRRVSRPELRAGGRPVCFLVEGPVTDPRKNVVRTIRLLEELGLYYRWVGTTVDVSLTGSNCCGIEQRVPYRRMVEVYGSADVLVKASNSEGMFGPPLEMFATGGTAAAWHVQGAEEYMTDRYNSLMVPMNSWARLAEAVLELAGDPKLVRSLQENSLATAEAWPTWEELADQIVSTIESFVPFGRSSLIRQVATNHLRSTIHSGPLVLESQRASVESARASRALAELELMKSSRAWRLAHLLNRARTFLAPDGSRRWNYLSRTSLMVTRAGRRIDLLMRTRSFPSGVNRRIPLDADPG
jgi:hypothetical protein